MTKRDFIKLSAVTATAIFLPTTIFAGESDGSFDYKNFDNIQFDKNVFSSNNPQILVIFLPGGSSQLAGNFTNSDEIKRLSESNYPNIDVSENGFWNGAGGEEMESMLANKQLSVVRTIFREKSNTRSHGTQIIQNQTGSLDGIKSGFFSDILYILNKNGLMDEDSIMPSLSFTGGTPVIFQRGSLEIPSHLNFSSIDSDLDNPYSMKENRYLENQEDELLQALADRQNQLLAKNEIFKKANNNFQNKTVLSAYIDSIKESEVLTEFPDTNYGRSIRSSLKVMLNNQDSRLSFMEFGGWDDHSGAVNNYKRRISDIFKAVNSGVKYLKSQNNRTISIWLFTEFGRNVNLNKSLGWDHGNIFNLYVAGNNPTYLNMGKIFGETELFKPKLDGNRVYMQPTEDSEKYEPFAIASTIHKIFGIKNPEVLTGENAIESLLI